MSESLGHDPFRDLFPEVDPLFGAFGQALGGAHEMNAASHTCVECTSSHLPLVPDSRSKKAHGRTLSVMRHLMQLMKGAQKPGPQTPLIHPTVDLVAQLFHAILKEDSMTPHSRVWFARLQLPVIREALIDSVAFQDQSHPAINLIAKIGSCGLGLDGEELPCGVLEQEIKRLVLLIERFSLADRQVFELANKEFDNFLAEFKNKNATKPSLDCDVCEHDQLNALTVQYQIAMRNKLSTAPVQAEIRDFLQNVWSHALAVHAVHKGLKHADTLELKRTAVDLIQLNTALLRRKDRSSAIGKVPHLVQRLRRGMTLIGLSPEDQDEHIKKIGNNLTDAFLTEHRELNSDIPKTDRRSTRRVPKLTVVLAINEPAVSGLDVIDDDADIAWHLWECALIEQGMKPSTLPTEPKTPIQKKNVQGGVEPTDYWKAYSGDNL